jgi:hypothetical protein
VTQFDTYPLRLIKQATSALHGSKYFSTVDFFSGFWPVRIAKEDKLKTAFSTPPGNYHFERLPNGLSNTPPTFKRLIDVILRNVIGEHCYILIDDVLVFADSIEEHTRQQENVLQRFEKANLMLQPEKCAIARPQVKYLGYVMSRDDVTASPDKVKAVRQNPVPRNAKELRFFLGLDLFYRRLVPKFVEIAKPLTQLIRKYVQLKWKSRREAAFEKPKDILCSEKILAYPDFNSQFILMTCVQS